MLTTMRRRLESERGFTLIELLVVVLIIGILAAIAIPAFLGQRQKSQDAASKSEIRTAQSAAEAFYSDNQSYVGFDTAALKKIEPSISSTTVTGTSTSTAYVLSETSDSGNVFTITKGGTATAPTVARTCTTKGQGSCPASGNW